MRRLGHDVRVFDPNSVIPSSRLIGKWKWYTGSFGLADIVRRRYIQRLGSTAYDLAWVDHGEIVGPGMVRDLKARIPRVVCYNVDDPFGNRDANLWRQYRRAVPYYDLLAVVRVENIEEARRCGAKRVMHVFRSADEVAHTPRQLTPQEYKEWQSDVVFVGTAFPERGPFLTELVKLGVPLTLYGNRYDRLREWQILRSHWRPGNAGTVDGYAKAISAAKICLGLLSKGNRDLHTQRSLEIPSLGGLFCAERTVEHSSLYEEDREAVFWNTPEECAAKCAALLADDSRRRSIAEAGHQRYIRNPWKNMDVIGSILREVLKSGPQERQE
jgi:hypothetical protein